MACAWRACTRRQLLLCALWWAPQLGCGEFTADRDQKPDITAFSLDCPLYCAVLMTRCTENTVQFASLDACNHTCAGYPRSGRVGEAGGNTLECRFTFAFNARDGTQQSFCQNAGASGGTSCRD